MRTDVQDGVFICSLCGEKYEEEHLNREASKNGCVCNECATPEPETTVLTGPDSAFNSVVEELKIVKQRNAALLEACKMALVQIKQDNDQRNVPSDFRGTEWLLKAAIALAEKPLSGIAVG